jgi:hypothetical protein
MTLPNFLVIGVAKGGTTSLHHYLRQHRDIHLYPDKGTNYFWTEAGEEGRKTAKTLAEYERLFDGATTQRAIGEISNQYLNSETAAERIRRDLPHARLIVSLRNPVDRAWSDYLGRVRTLRESGTFEEAIRPGRPCLEWGFYYPRLKRYYDLFPRQQIHVMLYDDFTANPQRALRELFTFLGIDPDAPIDMTTKHNAAGVPRSMLVNRVLWPAIVGMQKLVPRRFHGSGVLAKLLWKTYRPAPKLSAELRAQLRETYREDINATAELIGRDLSRWLN